MADKTTATFSLDAALLMIAAAASNPDLSASEDPPYFWINISVFPCFLGLVKSIQSFPYASW